MSFPDLLPQTDLDRARNWPRLLFPRRNQAIVVLLTVALALLLRQV